MGAPADKGNSEGLGRFLPVITWLPTYDRGDLRPDAMAAVTIAAFSIPELMAFAKLAGLAPQYGLYAGIVAGVVYFLFGTVRHLSVGPTASQAILVASVLGVMAASESDRYLALAMMTSIMVGIVFLLARMLRLGYIISFIPVSVFKGFLAGVGLTIIVGQLPKLFSIEVQKSDFFDELFYLLRNIMDANLHTLGLGILLMALLMVLEWKARKLPGTLIVVIVSILVMTFTDLHDLGVEIVGEIPSGLPTPTIPDVAASDIGALLPLVFALFIVSFVETMAIGRNLGHKYGYKPDPDQELVALGGSNLVVGFFQGFPVSGSFSRSLLNERLGARTQLAGLMAAIMMAVVVMWFTGAFHNMPEVVLAVLIIFAVYRMVNFAGLHRIRVLHSSEFYIAMASFGGVLVFGVLEGVLIGVVISFLYIVYRISSPNIVVLGRVPGTDHFTDIQRHPDNETYEGVLIVRVDAPLVFANTHTVKDTILDLVDDDPTVDFVVIDLQTSTMLDITASDMLVVLNEALEERGVDLRLAEAIAEVEDMLVASGVSRIVGTVDFSHNLQDVVEEAVGERKSG